MEEALLALGIARAAVPIVLPILQSIFAESRDPTDEEKRVLRNAQTVEEDEFNSDMPVPPLHGPNGDEV
jgi:hypothetical protein